jgi:hypothetical protein
LDGRTQSAYAIGALIAFRHHGNVRKDDTRSSADTVSSKKLFAP